MPEHRGATASAGGAIGLSAVASFIGLCCIGPWAVALFGVSGAIAMARFAFLKPWLVGIAAALLAWAFWRVYFGRPDCDAEGCPVRPSPWLQAALWTAALAVTAAFFAEELQMLLVDPRPEGLRND